MQIHINQPTNQPVDEDPVDEDDEDANTPTKLRPFYFLHTHAHLYTDASSPLTVNEPPYHIPPLTMSDEELDRDWKPNGRRPQSCVQLLLSISLRDRLSLLTWQRTIARSFSLELMDIFRIENSVADLDEQVEKR